MPFQKLTDKKATSRTPQVVTILIDDSGSMSSNQKCQQATQGVKDLLMTIMTGNQGASLSRFVVSVAKFGDTVSPLVEATRPEDIDLSQLVFTGGSGSTEMANALEWAEKATTSGISRCQTVPDFIAESAPNPVVFFFSDGANTGSDIGNAAGALKAIQFPGGRIDVVAVGIGMSPSEFPVMERIASAPELAGNINAAELGEFLAAVGATLQKGESINKLMDQY